jgi:nitric-oxide synthase
MKTDLLEKARQFLELYTREEAKSGLRERWAVVQKEIRDFGFYTHTPEELEFGSRVAWRNSNRCIGRLFWKSLKVRDRREMRGAGEIFRDMGEHLDYAWNGGKIRSVITVYRPFIPGQDEVRIWNPQLVQYAGYRSDDGTLVGDARNVPFSEVCQSLGWKGKMSPFDILPVVIQDGAGDPEWFSWSEGQVAEIEIKHPDLPAIGELNLKWYGIPVISNMILEIGGIMYPAAPFNGWYMVTEVGSRNLGDEMRYNMLSAVAEAMGLSLKADSFWKDKALTALNEAVLFSYRDAGVTMALHHEASDQFLKFCDREKDAGRAVTADWSWIVPPQAASSTGVFHKRWENDVKSPNFYYRKSPWEPQSLSDEEMVTECPFYDAGFRGASKSQ